MMGVFFLFLGWGCWMMGVPKFSDVRHSGGGFVGTSGTRVRALMRHHNTASAVMRIVHLHDGKFLQVEGCS